MSTYYLRDGKSDNFLSAHSNAEGAKLSALFHVQNGDSVNWEDRKTCSKGYVGNEHRFTISYPPPALFR